MQDRDESARIKDLVIPPASDDVWICPYSNGHIQVIGADDAGRRQHMYHPVWREHKDREKFDRALELGQSLTPLRAAITRHLRDAEPSRQRAYAATVRAAMSLAKADPGAASPTARKKAVTSVMRDVAEHLGNTMPVARSSYVDPRVVDLYMSGTTIDIGSYPASEKSVVALLGSQ